MLLWLVARLHCVPESLHYYWTTVGRYIALRVSLHRRSGILCHFHIRILCDIFGCMCDFVSHHVLFRILRCNAFSSLFICLNVFSSLLHCVRASDLIPGCNPIQLAPLSRQGSLAWIQEVNCFVKSNMIWHLDCSGLWHAYLILPIGCAQIHVHLCSVLKFFSSVFFVPVYKWSTSERFTFCVLGSKPHSLLYGSPLF